MAESECRRRRDNAIGPWELAGLAGREAGGAAAVRAARAAAGLAPAFVRDGPADELSNPKIAVLHVSLLPQFVDPERGAVLAQSLALGLTQISVSLAVNACIVLGAGTLALWLARRPAWLKLQRWFMATVLGLLAGWLATERARP